MNWIRRANGAGIRTYPPYECTTTWPPAGFGRTVPAIGAEIRRGDEVSFNLYLRVDGSPFQSAGVLIEYDDRGRRYRQISTATVLDGVVEPASQCGGRAEWFTPPPSGWSEDSPPSV